ncbi:hypothetical protein [Nocardia sp. NPDC052566]|uniref:hypothetical protein n=1 Tax=Nocardia sp. NPDC052566 TaxID=3364330 RepID=UPI0037C85C01
MVNPWAWRDSNPYCATAFQILDIEPTADKAAVRNRVAARRKRISYDAKRFPLFGEILSVAQINAAEEQLDAPPTRLAAELLTHRPEADSPDDTELADLAELLELAESLDAESTVGTAESATTSELTLDYRVLPALLPAPVGFAPPQENKE